MERYSDLFCLFVTFLLVSVSISQWQHAQVILKFVTTSGIFIHLLCFSTSFKWRLFHCTALNLIPGFIFVYSFSNRVCSTTNSKRNVRFPYKRVDVVNSLY